MMATLGGLHEEDSLFQQEEQEKGADSGSQKQQAKIYSKSSYGDPFLCFFT